jgi:polyisoprenoid-binding protein YceI
MLGLGLGVLAGPVAAHAAPVTYAVAGGRLEVIVKYDRGALISGHDHVLESTSFDGTITWDPDDVSACSVSLSLPVQTLEVDPPGARARRGFEGDTSDGDKQSIKKNALSKGQLNADEHPNITYKATRCAPLGDKVQVVGSLTIAGTPHTVTTVLDTTADGQSFTGKGSFRATHGDFGFKPYTALLGSLRNDDALTFYLNVRGAAR